MNSIFRIGDFCFRLIAPEGVTPPENFMLFECTARLFLVNLEPLEGRVITEAFRFVRMDNIKGKPIVEKLDGYHAYLTWEEGLHE